MTSGVKKQTAARAGNTDTKTNDIRQNKKTNSSIQVLDKLSKELISR